jgi:hypothetical protein
MRGLSTKPRQAVRERCSSPQRGRGAVARQVAVDLSTRDVERIAAQVVQLLGERETRDEPELLSAEELAGRLRVKRPWVYRNRQLLGGVRIGAGPKAPWRFEFEAAVEQLRRLQAQQPEEGRNQ